MAISRFARASRGSPGPSYRNELGEAPAELAERLRAAGWSDVTADWPQDERQAAAAAQWLDPGAFAARASRVWLTPAPEHLTGLFHKAEQQGAAAIDAKRREISELRDDLEADDAQVEYTSPPMPLV